MQQKCKDSDRFDGRTKPRCCEACRMKFEARQRALARRKARVSK